MHSVIKLQNQTKPRLISSAYRATFKELKNRYPHNIKYLYNPTNGTNIVLVGTVHISPESAQQVGDVIRSLRPSRVMVELDEQRAVSLLRSLRTKRKFYGFSLPGLTYSAAALMGRSPGKEFYVAMVEAVGVSKELILGDIGANINMNREFWKSKLELMQHLSEEEVKNLLKICFKSLRSIVYGSSDPDLEAKQVAFMTRFFPEFLTQRDINMAKVLFNLTGNVVAVVGVAHLTGIESHFQQMVDDSILNTSVVISNKDIPNTFQEEHEEGPKEDGAEYPERIFTFQNCRKKYFHG